MLTVSSLTLKNVRIMIGMAHRRNNRDRSIDKTMRMLNRMTNFSNMTISFVHFSVGCRISSIVAAMCTHILSVEVAVVSGLKASNVSRTVSIFTTFSSLSS